MLVFDFFAGTGSATQAFREQGDTVVTIELDRRFDATITEDILQITADELLRLYGRPDFIWASPPCQAFSVASVSHHWISGGNNPQPRSELAELNQKLVAHARALCQDINPRHGWLIENPRGMLRKLAVLADLPRYTVTYCQYGDSRMKPTDLWGFVPGWVPRATCKNGDSCHEAAPRGARTGTQGRDGAVLRSMIPLELGQEIRQVIELKQASRRIDPPDR